MKCPECQLVNTPDSKFCKRCGTQLFPPGEVSVSVTKTLPTPLRRLEYGSLFAGRYEVLEELGKGGMGEVYRVRDHKLDEEMALKLLRPEIASDPNILERFQNELKLARRITHKNVCRMHDFHEQEDTPYITMEYVRGEDLKGLLKRKGALDKPEALALAQQVCEGLVEAHKLGVVHRDLKPQNIMIDENDNAKIMDFGIARSLEAGGMTQTGMIIGTPDYISPEQAEGREADHRSDIYSFGVILYEMVTGDVPFKGDTALSVALKHKSQLPMDPKKINPGMSDDLARLILICMEKDRERRYQTAAALLDDLRNVEEGFPLGTKIRPRRETFVASLIRKKLFIPAVVVGLAIIAIAIWRLFPRKEIISSAKPDRPSIAIMDFKNNTGDQNLDHLSEGIASQLTYDLMQSKYLYVLPYDRLLQILNRLDLLDKGDYSTDVLAEVADRGVVEYIIQGAYFKSGDDFRISWRIQKAGSWEIIGSEILNGRIDRQLAMVDELTLKIKPYFNLSAQEIAADIDLDIGRITGSLEAFVHYQAGMKFWASGKNTEAVEAFGKALDIDPEFAMAHIFLARILGGWWLQLPEAQEHWKKASALAERLTERERYFVEAALSRGQDAIEPLKKILELYPEDWLAKYELGRRYLGLEDWEKTHELLLENKRSKVDFPLNYRLLARVYEYMGLYDEAVKICKYYLENFSDSATVREILAHAYLCKGQLDIALEEVNHSLALKQAAAGDYVKGNILMCSEDWAKAEKEFQALIDQDTHYSAMIGIEGLAHMLRTQGRLKESIERYDEGQRRARAWPYSSFPFYFPHHLAYLYFQQGNLKEALKIADEVLKENSYPRAQVRCQLLRGHIYLHQGSIEEALKIAEGMKAILADELNEQPKLMRYHYLLMGLIEFTRNNYEDAEKYQIQALSLLPFPGYWAQRYDDHAVFYDALATTYVESGELDKAQEQYEKITSLNEGRLSFGIIYAKSFYRLGQIFEQKGWKGKAIEHYEKFLDLWKDADPGLPEVDDARKRLAGLKAN